MRKWFLNLAISSKLRLVIVATSSTALLLAASIQFVSQARSTRQVMARDLLVLARVVAGNSTAAVTFSDRQTADEVLDTLQSDPGIIAAAIYAQGEGLFADYYRDGSREDIVWTFDPKLTSEANRFAANHLDAAVPIFVDKEQIGVTFVRASLDAYHAEILRGITVLAAVTIAMMLMLTLLSSRLARLISSPILHLARTMDRVAHEKRFAQQIKKTTDDEIGKLIDSFNQMLEQLQSRDRHLASHREQIERLAYFDNVTDLPNRAFVKQHLKFELANAKRNKSRSAVLFIDLDHFKNINDSLGHSAGDELLRQVGNRLRLALRVGDLVASFGKRTTETGSYRIERPSEIVGRLGGDEFVVTLSEILRAEDAAIAAQRVLAALSEPFDIGGYPRYVAGSIGISVFPEDGSDAETLLKHADAAMYHAKARGRNGYQFFIESINKSAHQRMALEHELREAVERRQLEVWYQPRVDIRSREPVSVEALVRWRHPERGLVPPSEFIPIAESNGLITPIGAFVMHEACRQAKAWQDEGLPPIGVSVNLSAAQFSQDDLLDDIRRHLTEAGLEARYLEVELTESMLMHDVERSIDVISQLRKLGVSASIDDFGTGHSSLHRLKQLPVNTLKVDQSFVKDMTSDADTDAIVQATISLAHHLRLKVVAEGVETQAQLARLFSHDCDEGQGFLFCRPSPPHEVASWLTSWQEATYNRRQTGIFKVLQSPITGL